MSVGDGGGPHVWIHLLHGTWARGFFPRPLNPAKPRWFEPGSPFAKALEARLRERGIQARFPDPFLWSGSNSLGGRYRAVAGFRMHLERDEGSPRVVVAHSHGGNIALRAIATMTPEERPAGIATLSTPFIVTREKETSASEFLMAFSVFFALVLGPLYFFGAPYMSGNHVAPPPPTPEEATRFNWALLYTLASVGAFLTAAISRQEIVERAVKISPRVSEGVPLIVLRSPGDEASLALAWGDLLEKANALFRKILDAMTQSVATRGVALAKRFEEKYFGPYLTIASLSIAITSAALIWQHEVGDNNPTHTYLALSPMLIMFSPLLLVAGGFALALIAGVGSLVVTCFASLGYGIEYAVIGWGARTTCETTPLDVTVPVRSIEPESEAFLSHGVYKSEEAIALIADWIADLVNFEPP